METRPLVSVIIPVYNRAHYLAASLNSVFAQTYRPIEVIVIDDGSTDSSAKVAKSYPEIQYFYQSNQGVSLARNAGISIASGDLIAFLDADDMWKSNKLDIQIPYMINHPMVGVTTTHVLNFLEPGTQIPSWFEADRHLGEKQVAIPSTWVVRISVFHQVGTFSPNLPASEDVEWLCRAKDGNVLVAAIPEVLTLRRFHGANLSWEMASSCSTRRLQILHASIARKKIKKLIYIDSV